jgi:hypothetical protein
MGGRNNVKSKKSCRCFAIGIASDNVYAVTAYGSGCVIDGAG